MLSNPTNKTLGAFHQKDPPTPFPNDAHAAAWIDFDCWLSNPTVANKTYLFLHKNIGGKFKE